MRSSRYEFYKYYFTEKYILRQHLTLRSAEAPASAVLKNKAPALFLQKPFLL